MTVRAIVVGMLCVAFVCGVCFFNDFIMRQTFLVGNYMPISVYGGLLLFLLFVNPLLRRTRAIRPFSGGELAVIVALTLAACNVPGRGLMHYFGTFLMLPHKNVKTNPGWKQTGVVDMAPRQMLAGVAPPYRADDVLDGTAVCEALLQGQEGAVGRVAALLTDQERSDVESIVARGKRSRARQQAIVDGLNQLLDSPDLYDKDAFDAVSLSQQVKAVAEDDPANRTPEDVRILNQSVLESAFPKAISRLGKKPRAVRTQDVTNWRRFCSELAEAAGARDRIWRSLDGGVQQLVTEAHDAAIQAEEDAGVLAGLLNRAIGQRDFYRPEDLDAQALPKRAAEWLASDRDSLDDDEAMRLNRHTLDAAFGSAVRSLGASEDLAINGFVQGLAVGDQHIRFSDIPWYAWTRTLKFWIPLLLSLMIGFIGLALVVHRQWSDHEHLPYPIITFANALLPEKDGVRGTVFRNRLFWWGLGVVFVIHLNNYGCAWWPQYLIQVQRVFDFRALTPLIPPIQRAGDWALMNPTLYFTAMGFAYFLATDVSLSLGVAAYIYTIAVGILMGYGVSVTGGGFISMNIQTFLHGGAYTAMFLVLLYTGRHYYLNVFLQSVGVRTRDRMQRHTIWGGRVFLVGALLFAVQLMFVGLNWYLALLYTAGTVVIFTVISRIVSETGVFYIHAYHFPCVLMWGFFGAKVIGPEALLIMFMVTSLLLIDPREAVMPFVVQGLKLADMKKVRLGRTARWSAIALVLGFVVAVPVTIYWHYDRGVGTTSDGWTKNVPTMSYNATVRAIERLDAQGNLEAAGTYSGLDWFRNLSANPTCVIAFFVTFVLVLLFSAARLRFPRWPLHPVLFLILGTYQSRTLAFSFLVGWAIKVAVTKYGGASTYQKLKPLMIGVIAGDMLGGLAPMLIGAVYYAATGQPPKFFRVLPF